MSRDLMTRTLGRGRFLRGQIKEMKARERQMKIDWVQSTGQDVPLSSRYPLPVELTDLQQQIYAYEQEFLSLRKPFRVAKFVRALQG